MTFSTSVKNELSRISIQKFCCKKNMLHAIYSCSSYNNSSSNANFTTTNENIFKLYFKLATTVYPSKVAIGIDENKKYTVNIRAKNINIAPPIKCENCKKNLLRGIFISCATMSDPMKEYRIEFNIHNENVAKELNELLENAIGLNLKVHKKSNGNHQAVYVKGYNAIEKLLMFLGASQAVMELVQIKMIREERNRINRTNNFEVANIDRGAKSGAKQLKAIKDIGIENLSPQLAQVANLRIEYPEMTLTELSEVSGIKKSTLYYRLNQIVEKSKKL